MYLIVSYESRPVVYFFVGRDGSGMHKQSKPFASAKNSNSVSQVPPHKPCERTKNFRFKPFGLTIV